MIYISEKNSGGLSFVSFKIVSCSILINNILLNLIMI